jgi:hypothetical protein
VAALIFPVSQVGVELTLSVTAGFFLAWLLIFSPRSWGFTFMELTVNPRNSIVDSPATAVLWSFHKKRTYLYSDKNVYDQPTSSRIAFTKPLSVWFWYRPTESRTTKMIGS